MNSSQRNETPISAWGMKGRLVYQVLSELATLDPAGTHYAMQTAPDRTVSAWCRVLPDDVTVEELETAILDFHKANPRLRITAGDTLAQMKTNRAKAVKARDRELLRRSHAAAKARPAREKEPPPPDVQEKIKEIINKAAMSRLEGEKNNG